MPYNGSGTFTPYTPGNPVVTGTVISSTAFNATQNDIAAGLTNAVTRDGQSPPSANLPMGGKKFTGLAAGVTTGDSLRWEQLFSQGTEQDIASAATTDIGSLNTTNVRITGTTSITSFGTNYNGPRFVRFAGVLTLTHNATTLILPGAANITTAAGDCLIAVPNGSTPNGWRVVAYQVASLVPGTASSASTLSGTVAIANGGTGQTTASAAFDALKQAATTSATGVVELATDAETQTGTDTARAITPANLAATMLGGVGQSWQSVSGSRSFGTPYTNSTGRPIFVSVEALNTTNTTYGILTATIGGVTVAQGRSINNQSSASIQFPVPNGAAYTVSNSGTSLSVVVWSELR